MHFARLIESKMFVWGLALLALLLTSVAFPPRTHADVKVGEQRGKIKQVTQQVENSESGLILAY